VVVLPWGVSYDGRHGAGGSDFLWRLRHNTERNGRLRREHREDRFDRTRHDRKMTGKVSYAVLAFGGFLGLGNGAPLSRQMIVRVILSWVAGASNLFGAGARSNPGCRIGPRYCSGVGRVLIVSPCDRRR
jgi:hypothetical protein